MEKPLIGDDGDVLRGSLGENEYEGDGEKTILELCRKSAGSLKRIFCLVTAMAASASIFPQGTKVGEMMFPALGTEVPKAGDKFKVFDFTQIADAVSWKIDISHAEIDVTRLKDQWKKYRYGKKDATGSLSMIFTQGVTDEETGLVGQSMTLFKRNKDGTITITEEGNKELYFLGYCNKAATSEEASDYIFCKVTLGSLSLGGASGSAQSYDTSFRLVDFDPVFYNDSTPNTAA